jgi:hypothetical protein
MVCYLLSMFLKRITFEEHISYWLEALQIKVSVLGLIILVYYSQSS